MFKGRQAEISERFRNKKIFNSPKRERLGKNQGNIRSPPEHLFALPQTEVSSCRSKNYIREKLVDENYISFSLKK